MSRRHPEKKRRPTTITVPARVSAVVKLVFTEMRRQGITYDEVEDGSGVLRTTVKAWRSKNKPGLESIEAVMGFLGWDFVAVPRAKVLPKDLVAALKTVAEQHGDTLEKTIEQLIAVVTGIHERFPTKPERKPILVDPEAPPAAKKRQPRAFGHPNQCAFFDSGFAPEARIVH